MAYYSNGNGNGNGNGNLSLLAQRSLLLSLAISIVFLTPNLIYAQSPPPPSPSPSQASLPSQELNNIIEALRGATNYTKLANIISMIKINQVTIPINVTLLIPQGVRDGSLNMDMDLLSLRYHMILQRFTFSELQHLNANTRLPTLLTAKSILITNTSASNYTLDDSPITQPDVYTNNAVTVHGIATLLDYNIYGDDDGLNVSLHIPQPRQPRRLLQETVAPPVAGSTTSRRLLQETVAPPLAGSTTSRHLLQETVEPPLAGSTTSRRLLQETVAPPLAGSTTSNAYYDHGHGHSNASNAEHFS